MNQLKRWQIAFDVAEVFLQAVTILNTISCLASFFSGQYAKGFFSLIATIGGIVTLAYIRYTQKLSKDPDE